MQGDICMWKQTKPCCITNKPILCMTCLLNCAWMCLVYHLPFSVNFNILKSFFFLVEVLNVSLTVFVTTFHQKRAVSEAVYSTCLHMALCVGYVTDCSIYFTTTAKKINAVLVPFKTHNGNIMFTSQETFLTQKNYLEVCKEKQSLYNHFLVMVKY